MILIIQCALAMDAWKSPQAAATSIEAQRFSILDMAYQLRNNSFLVCLAEEETAAPAGPVVCVCKFTLEMRMPCSLIRPYQRGFRHNMIL